MKWISAFILIFVVINILPQTQLNNKNKKSVVNNEVKFFDEVDFEKSLVAKSKSRSFHKPIKGAIIPHHLLVSSEIANFFKQIESQEPAVIILLGPNHLEKGNFNALTGLNNWQTKFGLVDANQNLIQKLIDGELLEVDDQVVMDDQSISSFLPYIKYFHPNTKIVPILFKNKYSIVESEKLAETLSNNMDNKTIIIASVDFSHYLNNAQAKKNDEVTIDIINKRDYQELYKLNSDYLDSPPSIGILLMIMQKLNVKNSEIFYHSNSGELLKENNKPVTSYFGITY